MKKLTEVIKNIKPKDVLRDIGILLVSGGILIGLGWCESELKKGIYPTTQNNLQGNYNPVQGGVPYTLNR
jgi:hypothetical protein